MEATVNEVTINGQIYVKKGSEENKPKMSDNYVIVRTRSAGVFAGEVVERNGMEIELKNARRLYYWDGAATLSQLAMEGVKCPANCKFPCEVAYITLTEAIEIIPVAQPAQKIIREVPVWKR
jgi:hypothetical protein